MNKLNNSRSMSAAGAFLLAMIVTACGQSPEDRVYEAFKCGKAAMLLEREADAQRAVAVAESLAAGHVADGSYARYAMELGARFQDDVPLYRLSAGDQLKLLQDIYESGECQAMYAAPLLNLSNAEVQNAEPAAPVSTPPLAPQPEPSKEQGEITAALMNVARLLGTENGGDPVAVAQFCDQHARDFANVGDIQQCKALGGPAAFVPVPGDIEEAIRIAATLPVQARFRFCLSEHVSKISKAYGDDFVRCFPPAAQAEAERLGLNNEEQGPVHTSHEAIKDRIVTNSARMNARERKAYCFTPGVLQAFEGEPADCLNGQIILTDADPGYRDEGL